MREICSCSCLTALPGPAWILPSKMCILFSQSLYKQIYTKPTYTSSTLCREKGLLHCGRTKHADFCELCCNLRYDFFFVILAMIVWTLMAWHIIWYNETWLSFFHKSILNWHHLSIISFVENNFCSIQLGNDELLRTRVTTNDTIVVFLQSLSSSL